MRNMGKPYVRSGRYYMTVNGKRLPRAYVVWNKYNPNDPIKPGEVIHHKNEDKLDDRIENLQKLPDSEHRRLHGKDIGKRKFKEFKEKHPEESHRYSSNAAKLLHQRMKLDPKFAEWVKAQRREGIIKFNKSRIGEKHTEEHKQKIGAASKKNWSNPEFRLMMAKKQKERWEKWRNRKEAKNEIISNLPFCK